MNNLDSQYNAIQRGIAELEEAERFWREAFNVAQGDSDRKHYLLEEIHGIIKMEDLICPHCGVLGCSEDCKLAKEVK